MSSKKYIAESVWDHLYGHNNVASSLEEYCMRNPLNEEQMDIANIVWDEIHNNDTLIYNCFEDYYKDRFKTFTAKVTFPNDYCHTLIENFKPDSFKMDKEFDDCVFGWWGETYVKIDKEDYDKFKNYGDAKIGDKIVRLGHVQCLDGLDALINTQSDEMIKVNFKDREEQWKYYCKYVKVTIEVIDESELD